MKLSKPEARITCNDLSLLEGTRSEMIEKIGQALLKEHALREDGYVILVDDEDDGDVDDNAV